MDNNRHPNMERRTGFAEWQAHVDKRLDEQDKLLREIRDAFAASKVGAHIIGWAAGVGAAAAVMWANIHGSK
jgi:uncharacterized MAPEG superfamily protein